MGLAATEADNLMITHDYMDESTGIRHIYATQKLNGLTITNSSFALHANDKYQAEADRLVRFTTYATAPVQTSVTSSDAVLKVFQAVNYSGPTALTVKQEPQGIEKVTVYSRNASKIWDIACRLVYYNNTRLKALIPAWEVQMMDSDKRHFWLSYVDAMSGHVLQKTDLVQHCSFDGVATDANPNKAEKFAAAVEYFGGTDPVGKTSAIAANKYRVYDMPSESPIDPVASHSLSTKSGDTLSIS